MQDMKSISAFYRLQLTAVPSNSLSDFSSAPSCVLPLLERFNHFFQEPHQLPPVCTISHKITLRLDAPPINMRPYCYPHFQKDEIEHLLQEMLSIGIIRHSTSSFSSPALLLKKKNGTCLFEWSIGPLTTLLLRTNIQFPQLMNSSTSCMFQTTLPNFYSPDIIR